MRNGKKENTNKIIALGHIGVGAERIYIFTTRYLPYNSGKHLERPY